MTYRVNANQITTSYTATLAEFIAGLKYEDIPSEVREHAKKIVIQTVCGSFSAKGTPTGEQAVRIGQMNGAGEPCATLWTDGGRVSIISAAFTAGVLANAPAWADGWTGLLSAGVVPAALVVSEAGRLDGRALITAVVAGYEVSRRVDLVVQPPADRDAVNSWEMTGRQVFAAVVPAARLLGLTAEQIEQAMGFGCLCCPPRSSLRRSAAPGCCRFEYGFRAQDGILCALTARAGVDHYTGCFDDPYSWDYHMCLAPRRDWYIKDLGKRWLTLEAPLWNRTPAALQDGTAERTANAFANIEACDDLSKLSKFLY